MRGEITHYATSVAPDETAPAEVLATAASEVMTEVLGILGIEPAALPLFEASDSVETAERPVDAVADSPTDQPEVRAYVAPTADESLQLVAEEILQRYAEVEQRLALVAPERLQEIRKTLLTIQASLHREAESAMPENAQAKLLQLLQMLGFENPSRAITSYVNQYGIDFVDEWLARFFELLSQGHSFERIRVIQPQVLSQQAATDAPAILGTIALFLARFGEQGTPRLAQAA